MTTSTADKVLDALRSFDLKRESDGQYRCNSPLRPGSNSHGFSVTIDDGEHGAFDDKVSGDSGSLYKLAALLGIETPKGDRAPVADTKRAYRDLADYAVAHGLTADDLLKSGWEDVQTYQGRPALAFRTATGTRYRFLDGEKPYYKSENGYKACWYGLTRAMELARQNDKPLVLCNGEISTIAAQKAGIPACCVTGGEKRLPQDALDALDTLWKGGVWLAYDCDDTGRRVAEEVAGQLPHAVAIDLGMGDKGDLADFVMLHTATAAEALAKLAVVAPKTDSQKTDAELLMSAVDTLAKSMRATDRSGVDMDTALAAARSQLDRISMKLARPVVRSFADLIHEQLQQAAERVEATEANGGVSPFEIEGLRSGLAGIDSTLHGFRPEIYVVYGATGSGKTFFAVSLAREFLKQAPGFIVSTELQPGRWINRLVASMARVSTSEIRQGWYSERGAWQRVKDAYGQLAEMNCHVLDASSPTPSLIRAAFLQGMDAGYAYEWMIVDSASKMRFPGATGIYDTTVGVSNGLQDLMRETNVPVIITNQVGRDVAERPQGKKIPQLEDAYGGGVIEHNAGAVIGLYHHHYYVKRGLEPESTEMPEGVVLARFLKMRDEDDSAVPTIKLHLVGGMGFYNWNGVTQTTSEMIEKGLRVS